MSTTILILGTIVIVSILGLAGGVLLLWKEKIAKKITLYLVAFAAGGLLGITFFNLLPEAIGHGQDVKKVLLVVFCGFLLFYIIERVISSFHCHHHDCQIKAPRYLIVIGDFVHNFIDGVLIAATFMIDVRLGFVTSVGVLLHELPQEIGDFAVLLYTGLSRAKAIWYNLLSAGGALVGGAVVLLFGHSIEEASPVLLAIVAGNFLYLAAVDLIPSAHHHAGASKKREFALVVSFILGAALLWGISVALPHEHAHAGDHEHEATGQLLDLDGDHDALEHEHEH